jgi:thioesterase domain-containing protein/acyl carrier protein
VKNVEDVYVLSSLQQRMLVHALAGGGRDVLHERLTCTIRGNLDVPAIRRAWQTVIDRHPALRTAFAWEGLKKPLQVVRKQVALPWEEHDLRGLAVEEQERRRVEVLDSDGERGFQLTRAPLMRLTLMQMADSTFDFAWSCHHLVTDGWCLPLVLGEVFTFYEAYRRGRSVGLERPQPFREYIAWLQDQDAQAAQAFWQQYLSGYAATVRLPMERPFDLAVAEAERFEEETTLLSAECTEDLRALATTHRVSLSTVVEGAWALLLGRLSCQRDVIYGATVSGRPAQIPHVESIVGPFINNLPVRVKVSPDEELTAWLGKLHAEKVEVQQFEYCPLEEIQESTELPQGQRLFESLVVFENYPLDAEEFSRRAGLEIDNVHGTATAGYPLTLVAVPGDRLSLRLRYDLRRFERDAVRRLLSHLVSLLKAAAATGPQRLSDLALERTDAASSFDPRAFISSFSSGVMEDTRVRALVTDWEELARSVDSPASLEMLVLDDWGHPAPVDVPGELCVGGGGLAGELLDRANVDPGQCASWPRGEGKPNNWHRTGVRARRLADERIEYLGRIEDPAEIGLYRVDPERVRSLLTGHELVTDAAVVARRGPLGIVRLAAYVVPAKQSKTILDPKENALLLDHLRKLLEQHLPSAVVPTALVAVEGLPRTADGHLDLAALPEPTRPRPESAGTMVAPRDPLEAQLATIWSELLGVYPVGITDRFMDLGGDSALAVSLVSRIEDRLGRKLPMVALFHEPTVEYLADLLRRPAGSPEENSLVPIQPQGPRRPLYCIHPAGGTVFCYLELARFLDDDQPVYGLQAQGIDGVLAPHTSVEEMAEHYVKAIRLQQERGPYLICGWSSGGIIAFEVARQIEEQGEDVDVLALFDAGMHDPEEGSFDENDLLPMLMMMFPGESKEKTQALQKAPAEEQLAYFQKRAELAQLVVAGAAASQAQNVYQVFQANMEAITQYRPKPYRGKITLFRATEHTTPMHKDPHLGWGRWAGDRVDVYEVPGNHVTMFRPPIIKIVAEHLTACLARDQSESASG